MRMHLFIAALFLLSFKTPGIKTQTIAWNSGHRLSWSDFKGVPPANSSNAALTSSGILMSFTTNGESFDFDLSCNFDQNNSWGRVKNDYILAHEQGHFDIAEVYTSKLHKALKGYRYKPDSFNKDINTIYRNTMQELEEAQRQYDQQTDHSRNVEQQKNWLLKIRDALNGLQAFANYK